jgi:alpha-aminoadipic semialdehyde synthase
VPDIGIRREDKNHWERRAPVSPVHVAELVAERGHSVVVQPSQIRIYSDQEYREAGATVAEDLRDCGVILGVKEVPAEKLLAGKPHLFFAHVIKGQPANMPLLGQLLQHRVTMIDYERIVDSEGRRLIFFSRHAGYAGLIDSLWALGSRLKLEGIDNAFTTVRPAHAYTNVEEAAQHLVETVGRKIREEGVNPALHPLVFGFTGGGNVSQGAQEVFDRLPVLEIHPDDLPNLAANPNLSRRAIYKTVFRRQERQRFARHLPYLTALINGIYWEPSHPRLVTRENLRHLWSTESKPRLRILADLSCDLEGSIEATVQVTTPDDPVFVFDPMTGEAKLGMEGRGPLVLAVDNLPCELPRDATEHFSDSLLPFLPRLARADFGAAYEDLVLPTPLYRAVITHQGRLTPPYRHLEEPLRAVIGG